MAQFPVISIAAYSIGVEGERPQHSWNAFWFVKAIKGDAVKGSVYVPVCGTQSPLSAENAQAAIEWFGRMAAERLYESEIDLPAAIVPIPPSTLTTDAKQASGIPLLLAQSLASQTGATVYDALRWSSPMQSARTGGSRDPKSLYEAMIAMRPAGPACILVDDVITSGHHFAAAASHLRKLGCPVVAAVVAGKTMRAAIPADSFTLSDCNCIEYDPSATGFFGALCGIDE